MQIQFSGHEGDISRNNPISARHTVLLMVDVQNSEISPNTQKEHPDYYQHLKKIVLPNIQALINAAREKHIEVMYTTIESLTNNGRDRSLDHKLSGLFVPKGAWEGKVIDEVAPNDDDIVLPKTSSGVFNSTNIDYILRNLDTKSVIVVGMLTDQCVDMAVRDGADKGYQMICVSDACASYTEARHTGALKAFGGYCRTNTTAELLAEIKACS